MTTVLCLWEGKGHYREKQVCWSFDVRCLTSPVPGWERNFRQWRTSLVPSTACLVPDTPENRVSPCVCTQELEGLLV